MKPAPDAPQTTSPCPVCKTEAEPGYIETDNNGPIIPCYFCNREKWIASLHCEETSNVP